jgi:hypothetical protein
MHQNAFRIIGLFLFFALFIPCSGAAADPKGGTAPSWVNNIKKDKTYFYAVGYVEDVGSVESLKDKALADAKTKITAMIFEEADVQKTFNTSGSLSGDGELQKTFNQQMQTKSLGRITGVEIEDQYVEEEEDGGLKILKVWVLAKLPYADIDKEKARVQDELKRKLELVDQNTRDAQAMIDKGQIVDAAKSYLSAAISSTKVEERSDEFPIYINQATKLLSGLFIETGQNPKQIDTAKGDILTFTVYYTGTNGKVPVSGAKVNFVLRQGSGDITKSAVSGPDGTVTCRVSSLKEVRSDNQVDAKLDVDFSDIQALTGDAQKYYGTLRDSVDKIFNSSVFKSVSGENRSLTTVVIAMVDDNGMKEMKTLASKVKEALQSKGYKVIGFDGSIDLDDINDAKASTLKQLAAKGYKQAAIVAVDGLPEPVFKDVLNSYSATYTYSFRLIDTVTGEEKASKGGRAAINTSSASANVAGFVEKAGKDIKSVLP